MEMFKYTILLSIGGSYENIKIFFTFCGSKLGC